MPQLVPDEQFTLLSEEPEYVNILYYGPPGTGKTTHLASLANQGGAVVYVDAESGIKRSALDRRQIKTDQIRLYREMRFDALESLFWTLAEQLEDDSGPLGIVWDSLSEMQQRMLRLSVDDAMQRAERRGMERSRFDVYKEDWGHNTQELAILVREFRDLPCHWGVACLERRDQDDDGAVRYGPAISPAIQNAIMGYMDIVCHCQVELVGGDEMYFGYFRPYSKYTAKDRFGVLPRRLVDPTFERIIGYVDGTLDADNDEVQIAARDRWNAARADEPKQSNGKEKKNAKAEQADSKEG